jgi:hypothetical protein
MDPRRVSRLVERTAVGEGERDGVSKGWATAHPARARRRVRAARVFISPEAEVSSVYPQSRGGGGDYTYLSKTVAPDFQLFQDCFPTDNGSVPFVVSNSSSLLQFVKDSRAGFEKYGFLDDLHFGEDNLLTLR